MNRLLNSDRNGRQTVINTLAQAQTNAKEGIHARLSEYHGKSKEDVIAQCKEIERVAEANNWRVALIHTIIAAYLREAAADYYEEKHVNINAWADGNVANNLKDFLIA